MGAGAVGNIAAYLATGSGKDIIVGANGGDTMANTGTGVGPASSLPQAGGGVRVRVKHCPPKHAAACPADADSSSATATATPLNASIAAAYEKYGVPSFKVTKVLTKATPTTTAITIDTDTASAGISRRLIDRLTRPTSPLVGGIRIPAPAPVGGGGLESESSSCSLPLRNTRMTTRTRIRTTDMVQKTAGTAEEMGKCMDLPRPELDSCAAATDTDTATVLNPSGSNSQSFLVQSGGLRLAPTAVKVCKPLGMRVHNIRKPPTNFKPAADKTRRRGGFGAQIKLSDILKEKKTLSFEVFPPKKVEGIPKLHTELDQLFKLNGDFISCTYGALGTNVGESKAICKYIVEHDINCVTHFTVVGKKKEELRDIFRSYVDMGIVNALALRGDFQMDPTTYDLRTTTGGDFEHANQLIEFLHSEFPEIGLCCAGYPEKHLSAASFAEDIKWLQAKQDAGAEVIMCQTCHDVPAYEKWVARCRKAGIKLPFVIGIMPIFSRRSAIDMTIPGCIPAELSNLVGKYSPPPPPPKTASQAVQDQYAEVARKYAIELEKYGMEYTINEVKRYLNTDLQGVHFYALNKAEKVAKIVNEGDLISLVSKSK